VENISIHSLEGPIADTLQEFALGPSSDLMVMATHGQGLEEKRSGRRGYVGRQATIRGTSLSQTDVGIDRRAWLLSAGYLHAL